MASILIPYATGEGQTARVADRIAEELRDLDHEATTVNVKDVDQELALEDYDAVLVGASIHGGRHQRGIREWVGANRGALARKPNGFFQVSLSSADAANEASAAEAAGYVDEFVEATGWRPDRVGLFGGALRFSEYGFLMRAMMRFIAKRSYPGAETSDDVEFTDWESVEAFADEFSAFVAERIGEPVEAD